MKSARSIIASLLAGLLPALASHASGAGVPVTPSADQIVKRAIAQAALDARSTNRDRYEFQKLIVTEEIDLKGRVKERKEKDVLTQGDYSFIQRIRINGRELTGAELQKQRNAEIKTRQKMTQSKDKQKDERYEQYLTGDVVARFEMNLLATEVINDRPTYVISFRPRSSKLPAKQLSDRLINHLSGTAWIDAEDYSLARTDFHLNKEISFWAGLIGTLKRVEFSYERIRLPDGTWLQSLFKGEFEGRKLLDKMHVRTRAESKDFQKANHPALGTAVPLR